MTSYMLEKLQKFANEIGLRADNLYRQENEISDNYVLSVSWKTNLDYEGILYSYVDTFKPAFDKRLSFPIITDSKEEIDRLAKIAVEKGADIFTKKVIAGGGYVQQNDEFIAFNPVTKAEYALHEAWHSAHKKDVFGREIPHFAPQWEEGCAHAVGYLGAIEFFRGTEYEQDAIEHYKRNLRLAKIVNRFYNELEEVYAFRVDREGRPISREQKEQERGEIFQKATIELRDELGAPINNAFFIYWNHFVRYFPSIADGVKKYDNFREIVAKLKEEREVQRFIEGYD